jgi:putative redox protein
MVRITGEYTGGLHCDLKHEPSGDTLNTDAPKDNQGKGEAFSPTDLVATALGSCIATTMAIAVEKHGVDLKGLRFAVTKEMSNEGPRRIVRLATELWLPIPESHPQAKLLAEIAEKNCPVHRSLDPNIERPVKIHWRT